MGGEADEQAHESPPGRLALDPTGVERAKAARESRVRRRSVGGRGAWLDACSYVRGILCGNEARSGLRFGW
jgi:hypothetical protein